jgi:hypothetical protein
VVQGRQRGVGVRNVLTHLPLLLLAKRQPCGKCRAFLGGSCMQGSLLCRLPMYRASYGMRMQHRFCQLCQTDRNQPLGWPLAKDGWLAQLQAFVGVWTHGCVRPVARGVVVCPGQIEEGACTAVKRVSVGQACVLHAPSMSHKCCVIVESRCLPSLQYVLSWWGP